MIRILLFLIPFAGFALHQSLSGPEASGDSAGNLVACWTRANAASIYAMEQATLPTGGSWSAPIAVSSSSSNSFYPRVAMNDSGDIFFLWQLSQSPSPLIQAASAAFGGAPSSPITLSSETSGPPTVAIDAAGNGFAVWQQSSSASNQLILAFNPVSLGYWILMERTLATSLAPMADIAVEPATGNAVVVWQEYNGTSPSIFAIAIPSGGAIPSTPVQLSAPQSSATSPQVVYSATGEALVIWQQLSGGQISVYTSSLIGGTWSAPSSFSVSQASLVHASVAINALGEALLALEQQPTGGGPSSIIAATRTSGGVWSSFTTLSTMENSTHPKVAMSQDGSSAIGLAAWSVAPGGVYGIRAAVLLPSMPWSAPVLISSAMEESVYPALWMSETGANAAALWQSRATNNPAIQASLFSVSSGMWTAPETISVP